MSFITHAVTPRHAPPDPDRRSPQVVHSKEKGRFTLFAKTILDIEYDRQRSPGPACIKQGTGILLSLPSPGSLPRNGNRDLQRRTFTPAAGTAATLHYWDLLPLPKSILTHLL